MHFQPTPFLLQRQQLSRLGSSVRNQSQKKISSEAEKHLLPITAPTLESNVHKKRVAGHSVRYSRAKTLFEVEFYSKYLEENAPEKGRMVATQLSYIEMKWVIQNLRTCVSKKYYLKRYLTPVVETVQHGSERCRLF